MVIRKKKPTIGICVSDTMRINLSERRCQAFKTKATVVIFHRKDIDFKTLRVKGKRFNRKNNKMEQGIFLIPKVIYMQSLANQTFIKKLEKITGGKVFNNILYNKWEEWSLLSRIPSLRPHLPETMLLQNEPSLRKFLKKYHDIFLKPIKGSSSRGIYHVKLLKKDGIRVFYRNKLEMKIEEFISYKHFWKWLSPKVSFGKYILQQSVPTIKMNGRATDVRLNMNRNTKGEWEKSLLLYRVSSNESHIIPRTINAYDNPVIMKSALRESGKLASIENEIISLGQKVCGAFQALGYHMADLGMDIGVDENGHLWILEVNPMPNPYRGAVEDLSLTRPLEYALYLAAKGK